MPKKCQAYSSQTWDTTLRSGPQVSQLQLPWILDSFFFWSTSQTVVSLLKAPIYKALQVFGPGTLLENFLKKFLEVSRSKVGSKVSQVSNIVKERGWATTF